MIKELIISIIVIVVIVFGNSVTQSYTSDSISILTSDLMALREELTLIERKDIIDSEGEKVKEKVDSIYEEWSNRHDKLAYYIEHDELEKVETNITAMKSFVESKEYAEAIKELDEGVFLLKHIEDKYAFNLQNIF